MPISIDKRCYGCMACQEICPTDAIKSAIGWDEYVYPVTDNAKCVDCALCEQVCIIEERESSKTPQSVFAGLAKDKEAFHKSSSGGAFQAIVKACLDTLSKQYQDFYCVGCRFSQTTKAVQDIVHIDSIESVEAFCKSKYMLSDATGVYQKAAQRLVDKRNFVIFTGAPCQIAAMKRYMALQHLEEGNILFVDLICHGAPSQALFDKYIRRLEEKNGEKVVQYCFRTKDTLDNGTNYTRSACYTFESGKTLRVARLDDEYLDWFYTGKYKERESCIHCRFKRAERISDITIGDAWDINLLYPQINPLHGASVVLLNSEKALCLEKDIKKYMHIFEVSYDFVIAHNKALRGNV